MKRLILLILLIPTTAFAQIQVGPGQEYPTLSAVASARVVHPGDTIFLHADTYRDANGVIDSLIGTPDKWITIMPYQYAGSQPDSISIHVQYTFQAAQYLHIIGLHFFGNDPSETANVFHLLFFDYQYICFRSNHDIIVENCTFDSLNNSGKGNTGACLKLDGTANFQIVNCSFLNGTNITDGISLNADSGGMVRGCTFENMPGDGSHCKGGAKNIIYEQNCFINCTADGVEVGGDTGPQFFCPLGASWEADSIFVFANIFIGGDVGIRLGSCHHTFVFNNTCFKSSEFAFRSLNESENGITLDSNYVYNNIFTTYSINHIYVNASSNFSYSTEYFRNNLFHDYHNADPASIDWSEMPGVNQSGTLIGDPEFADTATGDFSLTAGSPAIGSGIQTSVPIFDYHGIPYFATARSIGAYEFDRSGIEEAPMACQIIAFPNPCVNTLTVLYQGKEPIARCIIVDLLGNEQQSVLTSVSQEKSQTLDISQLPPGTFTLLLIGTGGTELAHLCFLKLN